MDSWVSQLRKGLVELSVVAALQQGEAYGYQILQRLKDVSGLAPTESRVYPLLGRLAKEGLLELRIAASPNGPPRRYYRLTRAGRQRLKEMRVHWRIIRKAIEGILSGEAAT